MEVSLPFKYMHARINHTIHLHTTGESISIVQREKTDVTSRDGVTYLEFTI